jgi:hypothetical protein
MHKLHVMYNLSMSQCYCYQVNSIVFKVRHFFSKSQYNKHTSYLGTAFKFLCI